ncbi:Regulator of RpoS [Methylobacterium crusticola]|uniref:Regulator of RpoS n=1 Tax=Methylobacterium crusticola TaxID=1697972 RepID=A0ABQ4QQV7_9HYPH|nr:response regulator [Methylobacterium crusticola]GJD47678.1 Regulator of RpoS [Methylobacterium crusticola]
MRVSDSEARDGTTTVALVADRDPDLRSRLAALIRTHDPALKVVQAATCRETYEACLAHRPALAFVGLQFEDATGAEAMARAKARGVGVPCLVLIAAQVFQRWTEVSQHLDAFEFLRTPLDEEHIAGLLHADARRRQPTRLLLVDGAEQSRAVVRRILARSGFRLLVEETDSAPHALKLIRLAACDLAVIDLGLRGGGGLELACQIREIAPETPLVLMTGGDAATMAQASRHFGIDYVLRKPFFARDVDRVLYHVLGLRRPYLLNAITDAPPAQAGPRAAHA